MVLCACVLVWIESHGSKDVVKSGALTTTLEHFTLGHYCQIY